MTSLNYYTVLLRTSRKTFLISCIMNTAKRLFSSYKASDDEIFIDINLTISTSKSGSLLRSFRLSRIVFLLMFCKMNSSAISLSPVALYWLLADNMLVAFSRLIELRMISSQMALSRSNINRSLAIKRCTPSSGEILPTESVYRYSKTFEKVWCDISGISMGMCSSEDSRMCPLKSMVWKYSDRIARIALWAYISLPSTKKHTSDVLVSCNSRRRSVTKEDGGTQIGWSLHLYISFITDDPLYPPKM